MTNVVVVSGVPESREVLRAVLRLHHHRVKAEGSGLKDAKKLLQGGHDAVFLLDTDLADGTWEEVLDSLQKLKSPPGVVLLSSHYGPEFETRARRLGVRVILSRPFEIPELLEALEKAATVRG